MKIKWVNLCRWMLGIVGLSASVHSCTRIGLVEYGSPYMDYSVKGRVVDSKTGAGVAGIEVSRQPLGTEIDTTGTDGFFTISGREDVSCDFKVALRDVNPDEGRRYKTDMVSVELTKVGEGYGHWCFGEYEARDVVFKVEEQENGQK